MPFVTQSSTKLSQLFTGARGVESSLLEKTLEFLAIRHETPASDAESLWKVLDSQPVFVDDYTISLTDDWLDYFGQGMMCRFKSPSTDPNYSYAKIRLVEFDGSDTFLYFDSGTFTTDIANFHRHFDDTQVLRACQAAAEYILTQIRFLGTVSDGETVTETIYPALSAKNIILGNFPISAITSVTVEGETLAASAYELNTDTGFLRKVSGNWQKDLKTVIVYTLLSFNLNSDILHAMVELSAFFYRRSNSDLAASGFIMKSSAGAQHVYEREFPAVVKNLLAAYKDKPL